MRNLKALLLMLFLFSLPLAARAQSQNRNFTPVEGATLAAKFDAAHRQAAGATTSRFWTAYSFDVRPGVAVDFEFVGDDGSHFRFSGDFISFGDMTVWGSSGSAMVGGSTIETRNLGVFLLRARDTGEVVRVDVYNLERKREYGSYPVYWAGRAANEESLGLLRGLVDSTQSEHVAEGATRALALHDDRRVGDLLEAIARAGRFKDARVTAVSWLGRTPDGTPARQAFLLELARNEREEQDVRRRAIQSFGRSKDSATLNALQNLYSSVQQQDLKRAALSALARHESREAVNFLFGVARADTDPDMRKKALQYLGGKAGEQVVGRPEGAAEPTDPETEVQKQALHALSRRPSEEYVPMLINVARTHRKSEVRRQALLLLSRTGDARALELFREILLK